MSFERKHFALHMAHYLLFTNGVKILLTRRPLLYCTAISGGGGLALYVGLQALPANLPTTLWYRPAVPNLFDSRSPF